jgi:hypothetical protein
LNLALVGARTDHKKVGKGSDSAQVQDFDIGSFLRFGGPYGNQPSWVRDLNLLRFCEICLSQNTLLSVSYYNETSCVCPSG